MLTNNLGYPRIGLNRELKKACENYWSGKISINELIAKGKEIRLTNWKIQQEAGIDLIPSNDFSFYDHVLDTAFLLGAIPERYKNLITVFQGKESVLQDVYFAMARGYQNEGIDIPAMEMTKWFDTNYHYIVPEFTADQSFSIRSSKIFDEFEEARDAGFLTKPVILGPVSFLLAGKEKEKGFNRIDLLPKLIPVYREILSRLEQLGAEWIQIDEPFLVTDLNADEKAAYIGAYNEITEVFTKSRILLTTYFSDVLPNKEVIQAIKPYAIHIDLTRGNEQLRELLKILPSSVKISLGLIDGRNIWKSDLKGKLEILNYAVTVAGKDRLMIAPSCSLLHVPCDLEEEGNDSPLLPGVRRWMAFARQKLDEISVLKKVIKTGYYHDELERVLKFNQADIEDRESCPKLNIEAVKETVVNLRNTAAERKNPYKIRRAVQQDVLKFPLFPTTTIGSFPQTQEIRTLRAKLKKGELSLDDYNDTIRKQVSDCIKIQEEIGLDVLVHGEFERNDMVEYFGEQLSGFAFTKNGWVQSYGSRCVKPPVIYGDVSRPHPMTVEWTVYAQSLTDKIVKGMLTGPVTILQWSFVRDDQPREETAFQIAAAINEEVKDLEKAGIKVIQIDEPAIREGLPVRRNEWQTYLDWAVKAFRISFAGVEDSTQIHTHMCYSEFNDIIESIAAMDADVISIETSRSDMELLDAFVSFRYPNEIGPGVYDIHSPRVPDKEEMIRLLEKASQVIDPQYLWVNPDCGLKTRKWPETIAALKEMTGAARAMREEIHV
jgi:5-methyltetrahydropteroyltriglutamate--homocysteine methyltransferase